MPQREHIARGALLTGGSIPARIDRPIVKGAFLIGAENPGGLVTKAHTPTLDDIAMCLDAVRRKLAALQGTLKR